MKEMENIQELKIREALGLLNAEESEQLSQLEQGNEAILRQYTELGALISAFARPLVAPPASLKNRILDAVKNQPAREQDEEPSPESGALPTPGLHFQHSASDDSSGWIPLKLEGASIKLLSMDSSSGKVIALGKLEPGTRYPAHRHSASEDIYILSGDLQIGDREMHVGDFHHADAGSWHEENWSKNGCMILAISSIDNFKDQMPG